MPIGAVIGSAVVGAGASVYSAKKAKKASNNALDQSQAQLDKVWGTVNPFLKSGEEALGRISDPAAVNANFMESPDYKFRLDRGLDAVTTNKAVNGLLRSGSALKAVTGFGQDLASSEFGNWWGRQKSLADQGLQASGIGAGLAGQGINAIQTNASNQGNAAIATGNAIGTGVGSIFDIIAKYGGGGGASSSQSASSYAPNPLVEV